MYDMYELRTELKLYALKNLQYYVNKEKRVLYKEIFKNVKHVSTTREARQYLDKCKVHSFDAIRCVMQDENEQRGNYKRIKISEIYIVNRLCYIIGTQVLSSLFDHSELKEYGELKQSEVDYLITTWRD